MAEAPRHRVVLWSWSSKKVRSTLWAGFDEEGNLHVDGQDLGSSVEEFFGRDEYEYFITVKRVDVPRLAAALAGALNESAPTGEGLEAYVTATLKRIYDEPKAALHFSTSTDLRNFLKQHDIPEEFTTW